MRFWMKKREKEICNFAEGHKNLNFDFFVFSRLADNVDNIKREFNKKTGYVDDSNLN